MAISQGSTTWTCAETGLTSGNFSDGPAWIYLPSGSVTVTAITPAPGVVGGYAVNGAMLNPADVSATGQGFDARLDDQNGGTQPSMSADYAISQNAALSLPISLVAGDCLWSQVYHDFGSGAAISAAEARRGLSDEMNCLFVLDYLPAAEEPAPPAASWAGKAGHARIQYADTLANMVAALPRYSLAGVDVHPVADVIGWIDRFDPAYGVTIGATTGKGSGYQSLLVHSYPQTGATNYGRYRASMLASALWHLIGDQATNAQKQVLHRRVVSFGIQSAFPHLLSGRAFGGNGGHHQFHQCAGLWAIKHTAGHGLSCADFLAAAQGNLFGQIFRITSDWIANKLVFHTSPGLPKPYHEHIVQYVSDNAVYCEQSHAWGNPQLSRMVRKSDGAEAVAIKRLRKLNYSALAAGFTIGATVIGASSGNSGVIRGDSNAGTSGFLLVEGVDGTDGPFQAGEALADSAGGSAVAASQALYGGDDPAFGQAVEIDAQPGSPFAVGDIVNFQRLPAPVAGDVDWNIQSSQSLTADEEYVPGAEASYRGLQECTGIAPCIAVGAWDPALDHVSAYVEQAMATGLPSPVNDWPAVAYDLPGHAMNRNAWEALWPSIKAGKPPLGVSLPANGLLTIAVTVG